MEAFQTGLPGEALAKGKLAENIPEQWSTNGSPRETTGLQGANVRTSIFIYCQLFLKNFILVCLIVNIVLQ